MLAYVASDSKIMVVTQSKTILFFDKDGYICREDKPRFFEQGTNQLIRYSLITKEYGRFFLFSGMHNPVDKPKISLIQSDNAGMRVIMKEFPVYKLLT